MQTILISGGTGLLGSALTEMLTAKGYSVIILTRKARPSHGAVSYAEWDPAAGTIDLNAVQQADHIVHLAGANVADKRWTKKRKKEIVDSRVQSGELIAQTLQSHPNKVKSVISTSGIGWYGDDKIRPKEKNMFTEEDPADTEYLGETCRQWELSLKPVTAAGKRLVILRTGIVLSKAGGALPSFVKPIRMGIAAILGNGRQMISWIHIDDITRLFLYAIEQESMQGIYNAVSPQPVTNEHLVQGIAKKIKGKFCIEVNVPSFLLKLVLGELSVEVLKSATVSSGKVTRQGFQFLYPSMSVALENLLKK
ncbi:TIGR01777 family protein [Pseudoflavitalea sp. G-6-1-2]|uniref:TIGR01777 family oxidoreductase n=1 Tax=Pseudoflavitalea sp. G-6-1-2 TaxID=2728841 RepID=UPI00146B964E|nr:TIGR01777 family oxidoreductase [Pseudoflavitalea sp. G-6-1-2]NML20759.1 TIGR01777 family protein [Pseudoflavitalea sp. G-6-1-2]